MPTSICIFTGLIGVIFALPCVIPRECSGFSDYSIWLVHLTLGINQGGPPGGRSSAQAKLHDVFISGHFSYSGIFSSVLLDTRCQLLTSLHSRVCHKPKKSPPVPAQVVHHLGGMIGMHWGLVYPLLARVEAIGSIFNPLAGKFSGHTWQKPKRHEKSQSLTLLIGQNNSDQSEPCRYDQKTTWRQHHDSMANVHC